MCYNNNLFLVHLVHYVHEYSIWTTSTIELLENDELFKLFIRL